MKKQALALAFQKARRDVARFKGYIGAPTGVPFALPGNAVLAVQAIGAQPQQLALSVPGRGIYCPALQEGQIRILGWFEKGSVVDCEAGYNLMLLSGLDVFKKIGAAP